jgi:hypothetical protein
MSLLFIWLKYVALKQNYLFANSLKKLLKLLCFVKKMTSLLAAPQEQVLCVASDHKDHKDFYISAPSPC